MLAFRLLPPQSFSPVWTSGHRCHLRWLHNAKWSWARWERDTTPVPQKPKQKEYKLQEPKSHEPKYREQIQRDWKYLALKFQDPKSHKPRHREPKNQELSLFEELFPEETKKSQGTDEKTDDTGQHIPRLPLPNLNVVDEPDDFKADQGRAGDLTNAASRAALRRWNLAILVMQRVSKSLNESDFRRIAPKGQHIEDWKGPGDPLKVIPGRDQLTLQPLGHYFLLFPNPAYARAYQNHVVHTHRLATTHTPTSLESPMAPPKGMIIEGDDVHALLQNYALAPPSQKISLKVLFPPYPAGVKRLIDDGGYLQLVMPEEKAGRAVLFWVSGHQPHTNVVREAIALDGRDRGMEWALLKGRKSVEKVDGSPKPWDTEGLEEARSEEIEGGEDLGSARQAYPRWIITFEDENEARRFVRAWHRRPFNISRDPSLQDEPPPLVHAEYVW